MAGNRRANKVVKGAVRRKRGSHRRKPQRRQPYAWLGAGAVAIGMGVAMANGTALAQADDTDSTGSSTSSESSSSSSATSDSPKTGPKKVRPSRATYADTTNTDAESDDTTDTESDDAEAPETTVAEEYTEPAAEIEVTETEYPVETAALVDEQEAGAQLSTAGEDTLPVAALSITTTESTLDEPAADEPIAAPLASTESARIMTTEVAQSTTTAPATPGGDMQTAAVVTAIAPVTVKSIITDVLTWIGLGPLAGNLPIPALPVPAFVESLWLAVRQSTFQWNNQRPTASVTISGQDPNTGVITGTVNAVDYEGDPLTYIVTTDAAHGTVVVDAAGNFTYTPTAAYALSGGPDRFVVTVDDQIGNPPHTYGLLGALGLIGPTTTVASLVLLPVLPLNRSPRAGTPPFSLTVDTTTGQVNGTLNVTDPDGDDLTYALDTAIDPAQGTLVVNADTGQWTYAPTEAARLAAYGTPGVDALPFNVTVSDGEMQIAVAVSAPITELAPAPVNQAPVVGDNPYDFAVNAQTGAVKGSVNVSDPDGDELTFAIGNFDTTTGTLLIDPETGRWAFLGSPESRRDAFLGEGPTFATFTIVASDGVASATIEIEAPIDPRVNANFEYVASEIADYPGGLVVTADGRTFVTDPPNGTIVVINPDGSRGEPIEIGGTLYGIALGSDGRIYFAQNDTGAVLALDTSGEVPPSVWSRVDNATLVTFDDDGRAYVTNTLDGKVTVLGADGTVVGTVTLSGFPMGIAVGPDGRVYASVIDTETGTSRLQVVSPDGSSEYIDLGEGLLYTVAVDAGGRVYVADGEGNLTFIKPDGTISEPVWVSNDLVTGVYVSADGTLHTVDAEGELITVSFDLLPEGTDYWQWSSDGSGIVVGSVSALDPGDITYELADEFDPAVGSFNLDPESGRWIFIPSPETQLAAWLTPDYDYLSVDVLANGVYLTTIAVQVPVEAAADIEVVEGFSVGEYPSGVAVSADGTKYVTNINSGTITVVAADGNIDTITVGGSPYGIAIGPDGKLYVSNPLDGTVSVLDPDNDYSAEPLATSAFASALAFDDEGRLYVGNGFEGTVTVFNPDGSVADTIDLGSGGPISSVAVSSDGSLYAVLNDPSGINRLVKVTPDGVAETVDIDSSVQPFGVAVTSGGILFVTDVANQRLLILHPEAGDLDVELGSYPYNVTVGSDGRIYVTDFTDGTLIVLAVNPVAPAATQDFVEIGSVELGASAAGVAVTQQGQRLVAHFFTGTLSVVDPDGSVETVNVGVNPFGVAVSPDGTVYISDIATGTVSILEPENGYAAKQFATVPSSAPLTVDQAGRLYVGSTTAVIVFNPDGTIADTVDVGGQAFSLAVAPTGELYAVVFNADDNQYRLRVFQTDGSSSDFDLADGGVPYAMAISDSGVIYVADFVNHRIVVIESGSAVGGFDIDAEQPIGLAIGADGYLYLTDLEEGTLTEYAPTGIWA